jgi:hypothetical protein
MVTAIADIDGYSACRKFDRNFIFLNRAPSSFFVVEMAAHGLALPNSESGLPNLDGSRNMSMGSEAAL